jgi:membrane protease subunit HflC
MAQNTPNKKSGRVIAGLVLGIAFLLLTLIVFTADTTEYAVVTQFGNPVAVIMEPGLNVKLPEPIQTVQRLDKRIQVYETDSLELLTMDKKIIAIDYYGTWRISDPVVYLKTPSRTKSARRHGSWTCSPQGLAFSLANTIWTSWSTRTRKN